MGKLIVVEGLDGSGKATQTKLLLDAATAKGFSARKISFPNYSSSSAALIKMYLDGDLGRAEDVNPFAASSFYAVDRYANYQTDWKQDYRSNTIIIADRYVTSNLIYQAAKLPMKRWEEFIKWTYDFEYSHLELPKPDCVIYLDMPVEVSQKLMSNRYKGDDFKKDIHERDCNFLNICRKCAFYMADKLHWNVVDCTNKGVPRTIEEIQIQVEELALQEILQGE